MAIMAHDLASRCAPLLLSIGIEIQATAAAMNRPTWFAERSAIAIIESILSFRNLPVAIVAGPFIILFLLLGQFLVAVPAFCIFGLCLSLAVGTVCNAA
jgi:hypothetical protein